MDSFKKKKILERGEKRGEKEEKEKKSFNLPSVLEFCFFDSFLFIPLMSRTI